jgi:hypothetical protein
MNYVSEGANALARHMEAKLLDLPPEAGIIFVGVQAEPCQNGYSQEFIVILGVSRVFDTATGKVLAEHILRNEIAEGARITVFAYRGVAGACRVGSNAPTHSATTEA